VVRRRVRPPGGRRRPGRAEVVAHDAAPGVPLEGLLEALRPHPADRAAPRLVPGGLPGPAPALGHPHEAPGAVVAQALGAPVGVEHRGEVAPAVVDEGVAGRSLLAGDDREAVVGVGIRRHPPERRALAGHPAGIVVDVGDGAHPVGVDHGGDKAPLDSVGDRPRGPLHAHQVAVAVVGVGGLPPVARRGPGDPAALPRQRHPAPAGGLDQADHLAAGALEGHLGPTPGDRRERALLVEAPPRRPRGRPAGEHPGPVVEVRERELRAGLGAQHPVVSGGKAHLRPVGEADGDPLARPRHQRHVEGGGPPRAEGPHPGGCQGVVVAGEVEQGGPSGEGEVHLGVEEVAREGAHRVVHEARGGGEPQQRGGTDGEVGGGRPHPVGLELRRQGGVGDRDGAEGASVGRRQRLGDRVDERLVGPHVREELDHRLQAPERPPGDRSRGGEGLDGGHRRPGGLGEASPKRPGPLEELVEVAGVPRGGGQRTLPSRRRPTLGAHRAPAREPRRASGTAPWRTGISSAPARPSA